MNLKRLRELQESLEVYGDYHQLDEISQKLATKVYARRATNAYEGQTVDDDESDKDARKADATLARITRRYGSLAGKHAERAADSNIFGRKSFSWNRRNVGRNQKERKKLNRPKVNEELNIHDILISHLLDEGYAEDVKNAYCILENMSEEWVLEILDEKFISPFKGPPTSYKNITPLSPATKAMQKSDELQKTEPGSKRQKMQTRRSQQLNRMFQAARRA